jgi:prepilin-type N-terminal cleavage/methylation domain-containing protein
MYLKFRYNESISLGEYLYMSCNRGALVHKTTSHKKSGNAGFTLIELSVVITIIALVLGVALTGITTILESKRGTTTRDKLVVIDEVLQAYLEANQFLPCPAPLSTVASNEAEFGRSQTTAGVCASVTGTPGAQGVFEPAGSGVVIGMVPVKTLGISETYAYDAWNQRLVYAVTRQHAEGGAYQANDGEVIMRDTVGNRFIDLAGPFRGGASYAVLSHGKNRMGGYGLRTGAPGACDIASPEQENCDFQNGTPNADFRDMSYSESDDALNYFDDSIIWRVKDLNLAGNDGTPAWIGMVAENIDTTQYHDAGAGIDRGSNTYGTQSGMMFTNLTTSAAAGRYIAFRTPFLSEAPFATDDFNALNPGGELAFSRIAAPTNITKMEVTIKGELIGIAANNSCEVHQRDSEVDLVHGDDYDDDATILATISFSPETPVAPGTAGVIPASRHASSTMIMTLPFDEVSGYRVWCRGAFRNVQLHLTAIECDNACPYEND